VKNKKLAAFFSLSLKKALAGNRQLTQLMWTCVQFGVWAILIHFIHINILERNSTKSVPVKIFISIFIANAFSVSKLQQISFGAISEESYYPMLRNATDPLYLGQYIDLIQLNMYRAYN